MGIYIWFSLISDLIMQHKEKQTQEQI